jgi:hypothetical protein
MLLYVKIHWHFSCFKAFHPDIDNFKSNLTLLLKARFSIAVKISILKNDARQSVAVTTLTFLRSTDNQAK